MSISLEAVFNNKFRSILTALGIIFGVAAVIAMLAIGNGARQEILEQIKLVGLNNIIITPKNNDSGNASEDEEDESKSMSKKFSPGLTLKDAENIMISIPTVEKVSPEIIYSTLAMRDGKKLSVSLSGVITDYFTLFNQSLKSGNIFNKKQMELGAPVCVIGPEVVSKLFPKEDPIGKQLKCGTIWLKVIGVLKGVSVSQKAEEIGVNGYNRNVYVPIKTLLLRYKDRSLVGQSNLMGGGGQMIFFGNGMVFTSGGSSAEQGDNQLNKIVVQVKESNQLSTTTKAIEHILNRRHQGVDDFEITIPELLLKQEQKTKDIFNIVLGAIAGISLIVGGIGIMNIMLASVMERIREIGVRRAIGATKKDIVFQFLAEATFISISGGLLGILLGVIMSKIISASTDINTIVSFGSILLSFGVAASVGIIFGWLPARKAAEQDPVESLRHD